MRCKKYTYLLFGVVSLLFLGTSCHTTKTMPTRKGTDKVIVDDIYDNGVSNKTLYGEAKSWLGAPYKYGGHSKDGTDCSGMVMEIYKNVYNISLYRSSREIYSKNCKKISKKDLKEGDLVFFGNDEKSIYHVGLYLNENKFIHASTHKGVVISDLNEQYYDKNFFNAGRVVNTK